MWVGELAVGGSFMAQEFDSLVANTVAKRFLPLVLWAKCWCGGLRRAGRWKETWFLI